MAGAQKAHYASQLWHLDVPTGYTSHVDATRLVFPGKAMMNVDQPSINHAQVSIKGNAKAWITDIECATSFRPKMYGFVFARATEAFQKDGKIGFAARLNQYFPGSAPANYSAEYTAFVNSIDVLGLDYCEDWAKNYSNSALPDD